MYIKCVYQNCDNKCNDISMFRFPVHDPDPRRLVLWKQNSGNTYLDSLSNEELRRRYICAAHFLPSSIRKRSFRNRLIGPAVPIPFHSVEEGPSNLTHIDVKMEMPPSPEVLKVKKPTKFYKKERNTYGRQAASCIYFVHGIIMTNRRRNNKLQGFRMST